LESPAFDTNIAHQARIYDYMLGGKDNFYSCLRRGTLLSCADVL
jgi:hypothetical protein